MSFRFLPTHFHQELIRNGQNQSLDIEADHPVVKLFTPDDNANWLFVKVLKTNSNVAFGLIDIGVGKPHLGHVDLKMLTGVRGKTGMPITLDVDFYPAFPLWVYRMAAQSEGRFTENWNTLFHMYRLREAPPSTIFPRPSLN